MSLIPVTSGSVFAGTEVLKKSFRRSHFISLQGYSQHSQTEKMKIGIIGSGNIGATLAHLFGKAGHQVEISNSRGPVSLKTLVKY